jgi:radical SAM superfamily enzyme YgiQ (UPF0313 family)
MLIDIVYPTSSSGSDNYSSEAPLGILALYSALPDTYRQNVRILDSTIMTQSEIEYLISKQKTDIVAISCTTYNYSNALRIANIAKTNGAYVICGGIHITHCRDAILTKMQKKERSIDFLVTGYGESAFTTLITALANELPLTNIPNLSYVKDGKIIINQLDSKKCGTDPLMKPLDYSKIDFKKYSSFFKPQGNLKNVKTIGSTYTQRGCAYHGKQKCVFCSIEHINLLRSSELFEQDLFSLVTKYNVDHVRISDADFTANVKHMNRISDVANRVFDKTNVRPIFHCFARADEINHQTSSILQRLNAVSLMIGYESGSNRMLKNVNKRTSKEKNIYATRLLKDYDIEVIVGGLVLGIEGEDETTLLETIDFANELKFVGNTTTMLITPLIPLPGSFCFTRLLEKLKHEDSSKFAELNTEDDFNLEELIELWNFYFCDVPLHKLIETSKQIEKIYPIGIRLINKENRDLTWNTCCTY